MINKKIYLLLISLFLSNAFLSCYELVESNCNFMMEECDNHKIELKQDKCCCDLADEKDLSNSEVETPINEYVKNTLKPIITGNNLRYKYVNNSLTSFFTPLKTIRLLI